MLDASHCGLKSLIVVIWSEMRKLWCPLSLAVGSEQFLEMCH